MSESSLPTMLLLVDSANGIYVPRQFAMRLSAAWGFKPGDENLLCLANGPDDPYYWEAWDIVLQKATFTVPPLEEQFPAKVADQTRSGKWTLHLGESGDLFAVHESHDWGEE